MRSGAFLTLSLPILFYDFVIERQAINRAVDVR